MTDTRTIMPPRDLALVLCVILAWGSNFTAMKMVLDELPPLLFVGLRFFILVPLIVFFPRPASWRAIIAIGLLVNTGQFAFLFMAMRADVTAGLASLILQSQAPLTIILAALFYGERVSWPQVTGIALACMGLAGFGIAGGGNVTIVGLALVLCGALSWALGNMVFRRLPGVNMAALFIWASLIPPLPMLGLSWAIEGPAPFATIAAMSLQGWAGVVYVAVISTIIGYSIWGSLLSRHPAALVTPFALGIPLVGILTAGLILGETLGTLEAVSGVVILAGIALTVLGPRLLQRYS
ncbi:EamA family transporter [Gymnodinialimonas ceratoperidinii]|uniref:EamA family transporter n=1 Tax=Gymnodinialimonas ceratoperidinii TaxID=2856823 RepID=A0A8F6TVN9_9RHOB|nr:EamA family transporter [Gymnodinialimonas ceratoperidinii]QXT38567.1 EamA family transporter [Gymnodinialimonas ceratoperidinii]